MLFRGPNQISKKQSRVPGGLHLHAAICLIRQPDTPRWDQLPQKKKNPPGPPIFSRFRDRCHRSGATVVE